MKTRNLKTSMNSPIHVRAAFPVTTLLATFACLAWLVAPRALVGQQTNPLQKVELIQEAGKITANDPRIEGLFGSCMAISGDTLVVGSDRYGNSTDAAYVFVRQGSDWIQEQKLTASDGGNGFGSSVAISSNTIVVGAWTYWNQKYSGAAYVFVRSGTTWTLQQKLLPGTVYTPGAEFGWSVAVSGDTIAVGDTYSPGAADQPWDIFRGVAYIFVRQGTTWTQKQRMVGPVASDSFGYSIALSSDTCVVGRSDYYAGNVPGKAYVFVRQGTTWPATPTYTLNASDGVAGGDFGSSVAISSNTIVVGAASARKAYVFERAGTAWPATQTRTLTPTSGVTGDAFGYSVAVSGDAIIVGANGDNERGGHAGSAYVFTRAGTGWSQQRKLTASDGAASDCFGESVAVTGDTFIVGAEGDETWTGSAYFFAPGYGNATNVASYARRLLYVPDAAASPFFNPWDAAFLYKYRLYGMGTNAQGVNTLQLQFEHVSDYWPGPNGVYRTRSQQAEAELRQGLAQNPESDLLGDLLLDIYYDRTAADSLFARDALASADKARFGGKGLTIANPPAPGHFVIENEIAAYEAALRTNRVALSNYLVLVRDPAGAAFFQRLVPHRGLMPATYITKTNVVDGLPVYEEQSVIGDNVALFTGYKDLVLVTGLLRDYGQTAAALARLHLARGDTVAATNLIAGTQRFLTLQNSLWRGFFPGLTLPANDASGLAEAMTGINNSLADLETVKQNLGGLVNPLGFASDFLMFVQSRGSTSGQDTFDTLKGYLDPNAPGSNPLLTALDELQALQGSYQLYRESQDEMAEQFSDSSITYNDRLRDIVGVFPDDVRYSNDPTANRGSDLDLQYRKVELARNQILHNQTQMNNLARQMEIEIEKTAAISNIVVKYAGKRAAITEKIGYLSAEQQGINAIAQGFTPEKLASGLFVADWGNAFAQSVAEAGKGLMEADKERLAADEQAEVLGAELNATIKGLLLEMNVLLVDSREAALTLQQEVNGLQALYREKQDLERKLVQRDNRLSRRYFADPVHRLSVQAGMARANQAFEQARRWLFFMTRALEYKWNEPFRGFMGADGRSWSSASVFQLRNATELQDCYNALCDYDKPKDATTPWGADDWDLFSLRKDGYGYRAGTNAQGQPLRYVVAMSAGNSEPLDPTNAFRLRLSQQITNTGGGPELELQFNTARAVGNLFLGPTFTTNLPPTPIVGRYGTYLDKVIEVRIRLAGNHSLLDGEVAGVTLTYGGTSYIRNRAVGNYASDRPDRLRGETTAYSTRFWQYVGPKPTDWLEIAALTAQAQKALRSRTPPATGSGPAIKSVIEFADRSVAASGWTLTIPLEKSPGDANFHLGELDDIEIYFHHRAASRTH